MDENEVVTAACARLEALGYSVLQRCSTVEQGVDIIAEKPETGHRVLVEAKGGTSSRHGSARYGKPYTQSQVFDRVAKGIFTCIQLRAQNADQNRIGVALAIPDERWFRSYLAPVTGILSTIGVDVMFVSESKQAPDDAPP